VIIDCVCVLSMSLSVCVVYVSVCVSICRCLCMCVLCEGVCCLRVFVYCMCECVDLRCSSLRVVVCGVVLVVCLCG